MRITNGDRSQAADVHGEFDQGGTRLSAGTPQGVGGVAEPDSAVAVLADLGEQYGGADRSDAGEAEKIGASGWRCTASAMASS